MSTPFDPPKTATEHAEVDLDVRAGWLVKLAGIALVVASVSGALSGLQMLLFIDVTLLQGLAAFAWLALGLFAFPLGGFLFLGRSWAAFGGAACAAALMLLSVLWSAYILFYGGFSPLGCVTAVLAFFPTILAPIAVPETLKVSAARRALYS